MWSGAERRLEFNGFGGYLGIGYWRNQGLGMGIYWRRDLGIYKGFIDLGLMVGLDLGLLCVGTWDSVGTSGSEFMCGMLGWRLETGSIEHGDWQEANVFKL